MRFLASSAALVAMAQMVVGQTGADLAQAIANYTELSTFQKALASIPFSTLIPQNVGQVTLLIPNNKAFESFAQKMGKDILTLPAVDLASIFQYHIMAAKMTSKNFTVPRGLTIPTLLRDKQYNNRSAGPQLVKDFGAEAALGNVLFVSPDPINRAKLRVRQASSPSVNLRGGLGETGGITAVDGEWSLGSFHIIDTILSPPMPCSNTIRTLSASLGSLDTALNRTGLWPTLDHSFNVTCLAPSSDAFKQAGNPETSLNETLLSQALLFHTLPMVAYSNYLASMDGMTIQSAAGLPVVIKMVDKDIYFNDAKVISQNVMTNNGLIHVLDKVMSPNGTAPTASGTSTSAPTGTSTSGPGSSSNPSGSSKPNAGSALTGNGASAGLIAFVAASMLFL